MQKPFIEVEPPSDVPPEWVSIVFPPEDLISTSDITEKSFGGRWSAVKKQSAKFGSKAKKIGQAAVDRGAKFGERLKESTQKKEKPDTRLFGIPVKEYLEREGQELTKPPCIVEDAITYIEELGLGEEGIYRLSGFMAKVAEIRERYDSGEKGFLREYKDLNTITSALKLYFRVLPEPLFTTKFSMEFAEAVANSSDPDFWIEKLKEAFREIPLENQTILSWIFPHLQRVTMQSNTNKMIPANIAIVFSPTLVIPPEMCSVLVQRWPEVMTINTAESSSLSKEEQPNLDKTLETDESSNESIENSTSLENQTDGSSNEIEEEENLNESSEVEDKEKFEIKHNMVEIQDKDQPETVSDSIEAQGEGF